MLSKTAPVESIELPNHVMLPYVAHGDASGVPLLLLHGYADSWRSFGLVLPHLPPSIRAIALTQRGHGDASRPAHGYRTRDFSDDLAAFMDALGLGAAVIAGGSSGGLVARRFAIEHPDRTLGLALLGSPRTLRGKPGVQELWDAVVSKLIDPVDPEFVRNFAESTGSERVPQRFQATMVADNLKLPAHVWKQTFLGLLADDSASELGRIGAPTLIIWGDQDTIVSRDDQEALAAAIDGSRLVVYPGAGHALYWEEPERIAADLAAFVEEQFGGVR
jgi:pimeloyl-ACP methyl ester carboxylesterase